MWFIFPQIDGLGHSSTARLYAIQNLDEATAYLAHPVLGPRLIKCCEALLLHPDRSARHILGSLPSHWCTRYEKLARAGIPEATRLAQGPRYFEEIHWRSQCRSGSKSHRLWPQSQPRLNQLTEMAPTWDLDSSYTGSRPTNPILHFQIGPIQS